jgi:hypothetical protein
MRECITLTQFITALRTADLPKNLSEFRNLLYQLELYIDKYSQYFQEEISSDQCYLALLQVYVKIMCPRPDGGRHLIARFGALIEAVFSKDHPEYAAAVEIIWSESQLMADTMNYPTSKAIH